MKKVEILLVILLIIFVGIVVGLIELQDRQLSIQDKKNNDLTKQVINLQSTNSIKGKVSE